MIRVSGGYEKPCMTLNTLCAGNLSAIGYQGHAKLYFIPKPSTVKSGKINQLQGNPVASIF